MADLSHINGKALGDITHFNGKAKADISYIDTLAVPSSSTVTVKFNNSETCIDNSDTRKNCYDSLVITGMQSGDTITININHSASFDININSIDIYYSINSTSSWTSLHHYSSSGGPTSDTIPGVDYGETVRVRIDVQGSGLGALGSGVVTLTGGSFTSGSGTVTAVTPTSYTVTLGI